jgi:hypothetical protein
MLLLLLLPRPRCAPAAAGCVAAVATTRRAIEKESTWCGLDYEVLYSIGDHQEKL